MLVDEMEDKMADVSVEKMVDKMVDSKVDLMGIWLVVQSADWLVSMNCKRRSELKLLKLNYFKVGKILSRRKKETLYRGETFQK